jgi:hypothetical protein
VAEVVEKIHNMEMILSIKNTDIKIKKRKINISHAVRQERASERLCVVLSGRTYLEGNWCFRNKSSGPAPATRADDCACGELITRSLLLVYLQGGLSQGSH